MVDPRQKLKLAYSKKVANEIRLKKQEHALKDYNEFDLWVQQLANQYQE